MENRANISFRIDILRTILIFGIVVIHVPLLPEAVDANTDEPFWYIYGLLNGTLFRAGVPVLSVISGYLLFRSNYPFTVVLRKKFRSLVVPLMLWNLAVLFLALILAPAGLGQYHLLTLEPLDLAGRALGLTTPLNAPLHFLRDLFVCVLLSPIIRIVIDRAAWLGLMFVGLLFVSAIQLPIRTDILFSFYLGALIAVRQWNVTALDRYRWPIVAAFVALCLYLAGKPIISEQTYASHLWLVLVRSTGLVAFWVLSAELLKLRIGAISAKLAPMSFFVFCTHGPLLFLMARLAQSAGMPFELFYLLAPIVAISVGLSGFMLLGRVAPSLLGVLTGRRSGEGHVGPRAPFAQPRALDAAAR